MYWGKDRIDDEGWESPFIEEKNHMSCPRCEQYQRLIEKSHIPTDGCLSFAEAEKLRVERNNFRTALEAIEADYGPLHAAGDIQLNRLMSRVRKALGTTPKKIHDVKCCLHHDDSKPCCLHESEPR